MVRRGKLQAACDPEGMLSEAESMMPESDADGLCIRSDAPSFVFDVLSRAT